MTDSGADKVWVPDREEVWKLGEVREENISKIYIYVYIYVYREQQ